MRSHRFMAYARQPLLLTFFLLILVPFNGLAAAMEELLPPVTCAAGWKIESPPVFYDRETLSDRINGEAELYVPYGFERMAAARYAPEKKSGAGMDVEIYRLGSPLDAFGIYANYRQNGGRQLPFGSESNLSGSQLFLYQGHHFVHIQITGSDADDPDALADCGRRVAARLPGTRNRPPELSLFERKEFITGSDRYLPQSLLGYDFLGRGIMTDAVVDGAELQVFLLLGTTAASSSAVIDRYRSELEQGKSAPGGKDALFLEGVDPLYGPVIIVRKGSCLAGALKFSGTNGVRALLESICR